MKSRRTASRPPRSGSPRRSRLRLRPTLVGLEERNLLAASAISALSQYNAFSTGVSSGQVRLASFTDMDAAPLGHSATINWGDGTSSPGTIAANPNSPGWFDVTASHTYAERGMNLVAVTITNIDAATSRTVSSVSPSFAPAPVVTTIAPTGLSVGANVSDVLVASFTNADLGLDASDFYVNVDWGDSSNSGGTIVADPDEPGRYDVVASKPWWYGTAGDATLEVTVGVRGISADRSWTSVAGMPTALGFARSASAGDLIYQIGGVNGMGQTTQSVNSYDPATNAWTARASMPGQDQVLAAATGPDGKIYAAAYNPIDVHTRIDVYDPATDTWTAGAAVSVANSDFGMTTGPDGLIYLVGGVVSGVPTSAVYTYDPATGDVASVASLPTARRNPAVVTGPDGKIYAVGGDDGNTGTIARVDVYDPTTGAWTQAADMPDSRAMSVAGVGPDGRIYVAGGYNSGIGWSTAAFTYNVGTNTWTSSPSLLSWRLYEGGGLGPDGRLYVMGNAGPSNQVDAFNPLSITDVDSTTVSIAKGNPTITWAAPGPILAGTELGTTHLNASASISGTFVYTPALGTVLSAGLGRTLSVTFTPNDAVNYNTATTEVEIDVLAPPTVVAAAPTVVVGQAMTNVEVATFTAVTFPGATVSDFVARIIWADLSTTMGTITADPDVEGLFHVAVSGPSLANLVGSRSFQVSVEAVGRTIPGGWASLQVLGEYSYYGAAATSGGKVYSIGGYGSGIQSSVWAYDPAEGTLTEVAPLPVALYNHAAATGPDGTIYVMGGDSPLGGYYSNRLYSYNPTTDVWTQLADMPVGRDYLSAATGPDGKIYAIGGYDGDHYISVVHAYDPTTDTWSSVASLPVTISNAAAATGPDGRIYLIGGYDGDDFTDTVYAYDTTTDTWTQVANLPIASGYLSAAMSSDGLIYAIGGYDSEGYLSDVHAYDATTDTWTQVAGLTTGIYGSSAVTGPDGQVYLVGGYRQTDGDATIDVLSAAISPTGDAEGTLTLIAGQATSFVIVGATTGTAGTSQTITVTAYDEFGNVATGYSGPVEIESGDPNAVLPSEPTLVNGVGTFTVTFRTAGSHSLSVTDPDHSEVTVTESVSIAKAQPADGHLAASPGETAFGQPLTLTATYTSPAGVPTGTVRFYDGETLLGTAALDESGTARLTISTLGAGSHSFNSSYSGDDNNLPASSDAVESFAISSATTSASLVATRTAFQSVALVATVAVTSPGAPTIAGAVNFYDGETLLGTTPVVGGVATYDVASLSVGTHSFRAVLVGGASVSGSESSAVDLVIAPATTSVALAATKTAPRSVALVATATATSPFAPPIGGAVNFYDGDTFLGTAPIIDGVATYNVASLSVGTHSFRAVLAGGETIATSEGAAQFVIPPTVTTTSLAATKTGSRGATLVASVLATSPGDPAPTGMVSFYDGDTLLGTVPIVDGVATFHIESMSAGSHAFRAVFAGVETGSSSQASVVFSPDGPKVLGLSRYGVGARRTVLALKFDGPLDAASAGSAANYSILRKNGRRIAVKTAHYDASTNQVTLVTGKRLRLFGNYRLVVSENVKDSSGTRLDGAGLGQNGTPFVARVRWNALSRPDLAPAVTFANGQTNAFNGRFRTYVKNVLQTTVAALRAASTR